jgi:hypothetical protein
MTKTQATAEIFWTAFQVLPRKEQLAVLRRIIQDKQLREDLMDLAVVKSRRPEVTRPSRQHLTARQLLDSDLIGMWRDRTDIGDSAVYARQLRERVQRRERK